MTEDARRAIIYLRSHAVMKRWPRLDEIADVIEAEQIHVENLRQALYDIKDLLGEGLRSRNGMDAAKCWRIAERAVNGRFIPKDAA